MTASVLGARAAALRILVTGGPGSGKTTLLRALAQRGLCIVDDTARGLIQERIRNGMSPRPSAEAFAAEILARDLRKYDATRDHRGVVLFDRGIPDALGMRDDLRALTDAERHAHLAARPYHPWAFVLPPWEAIYATDAERDQTFTESGAVHGRLLRWYRTCGFVLVEVPRASVAARCDFVLRAIEYGVA